MPPQHATRGRRRLRESAGALIALAAGGAVLVVALRARVPAAHAGGSTARADAAETDTPDVPPSPGESAAHPPVTSTASPVADLPSSLAGTRADGDLQTDGAGHLVVSSQTKRFFDYFFVASGQESDDAIRRRVEGAARARLGERSRASGEAMTLFDRYGKYRSDARSVVAPMQATKADYDARTAALRALRRRVFGEATAAAFFADDERLEEAQRQAGESSVVTPAPLAESPAALVARDREWRALPKSERLRARTTALGAEAAARLATLDDEDDAWAAKLAEYRAARDAILARDAGATSADDLETLRKRIFTPEERIRVATLERIEAAAHHE